MADEPLKSAYELAMERLREKDEKDGVDTPTPLTSKQRDEIGRLREKARAKLAELEILHTKNLAAAGAEPDKLQQVRDEYEIDRRRVESSTESAIARVRSGE